MEHVVKEYGIMKPTLMHHPVYRSFIQSLDSVLVDEDIDAVIEQIQKNNKGTTFMEKNQKYLTVMVFGAVKAGKSTLGNFFAENGCHHLPEPILRVPVVERHLARLGRGNGAEQQHAGFAVV